jgi:hypothetical protein
MIEPEQVRCPECEAGDGLDRREFLSALSTGAATLASLGALAPSANAQQAQPAQKPAPAARPAEKLIRELYQGLTPAQRQRVVYPWNYGATEKRLPLRQTMFNAPIFGNHTIGAVYTPAQQELNERILRAICSDEEGYRRISRNGTWDFTQSFDRCGAYIFGDATEGQQFSWVLTGHHLTVRCDGDSEPDAGFGGPMYYGHSPHGFSQRNVFNYQTRSVLAVWNALTDAQRRQATMETYVKPRELQGSIDFRREGYGGIRIGDLTADQRRLVETVMRDLLSPFRREDGDEVMDLIRRNGGLERIFLGFFKDEATPADQWDFWRLEGPGFVWNYRVLPHVHCFVNVALAPAAREG